MARDSSGTQNQPQYAGTGAPADAADLSEIANYAALVGNRKTGLSSARTALTGADKWVGLEFYETDTTILYINLSGGWKAWESDWITYTPTLTSFAVGTGGSAASVWKYRYDGGEVKVYYQLVLGTTGASVGGNPTFTLPVAAAALTHAYQGFDGRGSIVNSGLTIFAATDMGADNASTTAFRIFLGGNFTPVTATAPHTWTAGSVAQGEFTYRAA